jgi:hypothetical protein
MPNENTVRLISNSTDYYLTGSHTAYTGSGTPWTAENTSPYELSATENSWTPTSAPGTLITTGGQPFTPDSTPIYLGYGTVRETVGIQCRGSTLNNAIALLRQLTAIFARGVSDTPTILAVTGGTNTAYYEIRQADTQESAAHIVQTASDVVVLSLTVTWTRTPFGGLLSAGETLNNASSMSDDATGSPDTVVAYGTGIGDLIWEGSPLNLTLSSGVTSGQYLSKAWIASVLSAAGSTTGAATVSSPTTISLANFDISGAANRPAIRARAVAMLVDTGGAGTATLKVYTSGSTQTLLYQSETLDIGSTATLYDFGPIPITDSPATTLTMRLEVVPSGNLTLTYTQYLLYYDYAIVTFTPDVAVTGTTSTMVITTFRATSGLPVLPLRAPRATGHNGQAIVYGSIPRYFSGASFWGVVAINSTETVATSRTYTVTAVHAPLFRTLRGGA